MLLGCCVCISGFQSEQRTKIAHDVETNGGSYSGEMRLNSVTHLICAKPEGSFRFPQLVIYVVPRPVQYLAQ